MPNIIQIEELVYTRLPRISKNEWLTMLSKQGVSNDYALLLDDYLLIEQTDYRFSNGNYISSERTVYNIDYTTYDTAENTPNPDNTEEIITVRYDSTHDRYYVYYTHFPIEDIPHAPDLSHILSEANIPSSHPFVQAPKEEQLVSFSPPKQQQPEPQKTQPSVSSTPSIPTTEYRKPWRQKRLAQLMFYYKQGYTAKEIAAEMECLESSVYYQLENYLNVLNPFQSGWISRQEAAEKEQKEESFRTFMPPKDNIALEQKDLSNNGTRWTQEDDYALLRDFYRNISPEKIANRRKRSINSIYARLFKLIGLPNPLHPVELTPKQQEQANLQWQAWLNLKAQWDQEAKVNRERNREYRERQKERQQQRKEEQNEFLKTHTPDGFYRPGIDIKHPVWGYVTVIKDNADVLKLLLSDGTKKTIRK